MKDVTTAKTNKSISKRSKLLLLFGVLFFVIPTPLGFDVMPDVIGCILLIFGLTQLSYFDSSVEAARKYLIYLAVIEFLHLLFMKSMLLTQIPSNRLLGVTAFSIPQGILYILIIKQLFGGASYFALRNNCTKASELCDGAAFMTYLAFFIRIGATLVPELIALLELKLSVELDFVTYEAISAFVKIKPVIVVLFTMISLGVSVMWVISVCKLINAFVKEAGAKLDNRYSGEYLSRPERTAPKKLKRGFCALCVCLVFLLDIEFDDIRILPAFAAFLLLPFALMLFKGIGEFKKTQIYAVPCCFLLLVTQLFRSYFSPNGAIVIYETELWVVIVGALIALGTMICSMLCVKSLFSEAAKMRKELGLDTDSCFVAWIAFCVYSILFALGFAIPYFYAPTFALRLIATGVFIYKTARYFEKINEDLEQKISLYGE